MAGELFEELKAALSERYALQRELPAGGMSRLFLATEASLERTVVLKVLTPELASMLSVQRFHREVALAAGLQHPNIVPVLAVGDAAGLPYFAMPFVEGEPLRDLLARRGELALPDAIRILRDVLSALSFAHARGIVHRDIKPGNVLVMDTHAVVADFGVAKALDASTREPNLTSTGMAIGTPAYMAPEQLAGDPGVDQRADLYAVGLLGFEMLTGRPPFRTASPQQMISERLSTTPPAVATLRPSTPAPLAELIARLLAPHPADRPQTAAQALAVLESATPSGGTWAVAPPSQPHGRRARWAVAAVVLAVAMVFASLGLRPGGWLREHMVGAAVAGGGNPDRAADDEVPSVAVLPFVNESVQADNEYFADGLTDELISALSQVGGLRVSSRTSVFALKGRGLTPRVIGDTLGVSYVIEGICRREGDALRVTVSLVRAANGATIWSDRYDRQLHDVFAVQDDIARSIVRSLQVGLGGVGGVTLVSRPTLSDAAYDLYLRGQELYNARSDLPRAVEYFKEAIGLDSTFAEAHAGLAGAYQVIVNDATQVYQPDSDPELWVRSKAEAMTAIRLNGKSAAGHSMLARAHAAWDRNWPAAEREFRRAIELQPSYADAHQAYAMALAQHGRMTEAAEHIGLAMSLDPLSRIALNTATFIHFYDRQYDSATVYIGRLLAATSDSAFYLPALATAYLGVGDTALALATAETSVRARHQDPGSRVNLGIMLARTGQPERAREILRDLTQHPAGLDECDLARLRLALGETQPLLECLEQGAKVSHNVYVLYMGIDRSLDPLRGDSRFQRILAELGVGDAYHAAGFDVAPGS